MFTQSIAVITLVKGRRVQLRNLILGLNASVIQPNELLIAAMDDLHMGELPEARFPVSIIPVANQEERLPLARARNAAAASSQSEILIMLDVDCIPDPEMIGVLAKAVMQTKGVVMGQVRYLSEGAHESEWSFAQLYTQSRLHPSRPALADGEILSTKQYELLWTLCLSMRKATFEKVGGMDERYVGYGAEDTDFAFRLRAAGIPFSLAGGTAFHQHHPVYSPPLIHFEDILSNAVEFRKKWSVWPMQGWLKAFAVKGLIAWDEKSEDIVVHRPPTESEIRASLRKDGWSFG